MKSIFSSLQTLSCTDLSLVAPPQPNKGPRHPAKAWTWSPHLIKDLWQATWRDGAEASSSEVPRPRADWSELSVLDEAAQYQSDMRGVVGDCDDTGHRKSAVWIRMSLCVFNLIVFNLTKWLRSDLKGYYHASHYFYSVFTRSFVVVLSVAMETPHVPCHKCSVYTP